MLRVAVIGAGVVGLTTAVEVQRKFGNRASVTIYASEHSPNTTGDVSAGLWEPYLLQETPEQDIIKWAKAMQDYIFELWREGKAEEVGISLLPIVNLYSDPNGTVPGWTKITRGITPFDKQLVDKYSKEHGKQYAGGYVFVSFTCEPSKLLPYLQKIFLTNGGSIVTQKVENLEEFAENFDIVVNCSGLGAQKLIGDAKMEPIRGQVTRVKAPWQFNVLMADDNYIIPNMDCVILGGTHQENEIDLAPREKDIEFISKGCQNLVPSLKNAKILKHMVGLRPGRSRVRVELERRLIGTKRVYIIHNYGHGGSGVTLCKGCAIDACELVAEAARAITSTNSKL